ncbi:MAG: Asp-tRNA(Asn)/Glu-tRNA(Gln) amidotransferase subunit GatC [Proteobacteria bacterium]|nr:Asp-tRNA(Asn)/Glu-tRNA(Gln) amidotransferase subunit GatC [Pseudomonadota bacterium]
MSNITTEQLDKIAHLARLKIEETDKPKYCNDLSSILNLVEQINAEDTSNVSPSAHSLDVTQRVRPDEVTEKNEREKFQKIAPLTEAGLYIVPPVIE